MDHVDALVGHLAWPLVALTIVIVFRRQLHDILAEIRQRVSDKNTSLSVKAGPLDIQVLAVQDKVRALDENQNILKEAVKEAAGLSREALPSAGIPSELTELANRYLAIELPDWGARVRAKDEAATEMGTFVLTRGVTKDALTHQTNEGLLLALAEIVRLSPEPSDLQRLRLVAPRISRLHVRYRHLLAVGRLLDRRFVEPDDASSISEILQQFAAGADASLRAQIDRTNAQLTTFLQETRLAHG
jgi:hypothetical protein